MLVLLDLLVIAVITAATWSAPRLARPTLPFGVRIPADRATDPEIQACHRRHGHRVLAIGAVAAVTLLGTWLWTDWAPSPELTLLPVVAASVLCGLLAAGEVRKAKQEKDFNAGTRSASTADLGLRANPVRLPWPWLTPALLVTAATAALALSHGHTLAPVTAQLLLIALVLLTTAGILRARPEIDPERPVGSARRYRVYLSGLARLLLASAACADASLLVNALRQWGMLADSGWVTALAYLPLGVALVGWVYFAVRVGEAGHRLPVEPGEEEPAPLRRDDDRYWHAAGMVYVNRRDPALLVHRRVGMFWTLNLGNPLAWTVVAAVAVLATLTSLGVVELPGRS